MTLQLKLLACLCPLALTTIGCDLGEKQIGDETESAGESESETAAETEGESQGETEGGSDSSPSGGTEPCEDGETRPDEDGCNTCFCEDGAWACTEIACEPSCEGPDCNPKDECFADGGEDGAPVWCFDDCEDPGQTLLAPNCHVCTCQDDGSWDCEAADEALDDAGCNTCTCEMGGWSCTEIACEPSDEDPFDGPELALCSGPDDALDVNGVTLNGDTLTVDVAYSGGCAEHLLGGCWNGEFAESEPVQVGMFVAHDDMNDDCDAYPSDQTTIDLTPLKQAYLEGYGGDGGTIDISLDGWDQAIVYTF